MHILNSSKNSCEYYFAFIFECFVIKLKNFYYKVKINKQSTKDDTKDIFTIFIDDKQTKQSSAIGTTVM